MVNKFDDIISNVKQNTNQDETLKLLYELKQNQIIQDRAIAKLLKDSNMMNQAAKDGKLDIRIDTANYSGDFLQIANGINFTMEETVLRLRDVGKQLNFLSDGKFFEEEEEEEEEEEVLRYNHL